jgi:hypothetical protein
MGFLITIDSDSPQHGISACGLSSFGTFTGTQKNGFDFVGDSVLKMAPHIQSGACFFLYWGMISPMAMFVDKYSATVLPFTKS